MVGNDIVDLLEAEKTSNWQRPRFLPKIFTQKEQLRILSSENPFLKVWQLWSMKEAAYKLYTQINPSRFYNPKGFECEISDNHGVVRYKAFKCSVKTVSNKDYVISEARLIPRPMDSMVIKLSGCTYSSRSSFLKNNLLEYINKTQKNDNHIQLCFTQLGVPYVSFGYKRQLISLTHHGRFGAFAIA